MRSGNDLAPVATEDGALRTRTLGSVALCLTLLALLTLADQWSKAWARDALSLPRPAGLTPPLCGADAYLHSGMQRQPFHTQVLLEGHLQLSYTENCGGAFGLLDSAPRWVRSSLFTGAATCFIGLLLRMYLRGVGGRVFVMAVPLVSAGALGNLLDRIRLGYVVDFIRYHGLFDGPTFNVADVTIALGGLLLLLDSLDNGLRTDSVPPAEPAAT